MNRFEDFTEQELKLLADAIWMKQRRFIAGDIKFREYGKLLSEILKPIGNYVPQR